MKKILFIFLLLWASSVIAQNNILIIGDSLSAGYGFDPTKGWVELLQNYLLEHHYDYKVFNSSISGSTTSDGLARLPQALKEHSPKITIIALGGNDGLRGLPIPIIKKNLVSMISLAKAAGSKVLLVGLRIPPNYGPDYTNQFKDLYSDIAKNEKISVVLFFLKNIDENPDLMQPDRIHPSEKAQQIMLDNILPELEPLLR